MKKNKALALTIVGMLVLGNCVGSVKAFANEATEELLIITESDDAEIVQQIAEDNDPDDASALDDMSESMSYEELTADGEFTEDDSLVYLEENSEKLSAPEDGDDVTKDAENGKLYKKEITEYRTYNESELPLAQNLQWDRAGYVSFTMPKAGVYYSIKVVRPNNGTATYSGLNCQEDNYRYTRNVCDIFVESGTYRFCVKTYTDKSDWDFDEGKITDWVTIDYDRPETVYSTPTNLHWDADGNAYWDSVADNVRYKVSFYQNGIGMGIYETTSPYWYKSQSLDFSEGRWTFKVKAFGDNPDQIASSEESDSSPVFGDPDQTPLSLVTDAKWDRAGQISFICPKADVYYTLFIKWPDGYTKYVYGIKANEDGQEYNYDCAEIFSDSGVYSFAVKTTELQFDIDSNSGCITDWIGYPFERPANAYQTPTNLHWLDDGTAAWDEVPGNAVYCVYFFKDSRLEYTEKATGTSFKNDKIDFSTGSWTFRLKAYSADPEQMAPSRTSAESPAYVAPSGITGLVDAGDGNWYLYENGNVNTSYSGLYNDKQVGWWLVLKGKVAFDYSDAYEDAKYGWWKVKEGQVDFGFTGNYESTIYGGVWYFENGQLIGPAQDEPDVSHKTGFADGGDGNWYLYVDGNVAKDFSGLYEDATYGWWLVSEGRVAFEYNDAYEDTTYGWWKVAGGQVDFGFTGNFKSAIYGGVWYFENGQLIGPAQEDAGDPDVSHTTGFADGGDGNWYLYVDGNVAKDFSGLYEDATYGWWLVLDGRVAFEFDDIYGDDQYGWWKVAGGQVDFGFSDLYESKKYGWWLITNGAVDFGYSDIYNSPRYGYWKVKAGAVDFGFNGQYNSQRYGHCYVKDGQATF